MAQMCDDMTVNTATTDTNKKTKDDVSSYRDTYNAKARKSCLTAVDSVVSVVAAMTIVVGVLTAGAGGAVLSVPVALVLAGLGKVATSDMQQATNRKHSEQRARLANDPRRHTSTIMIKEHYQPEYYSKRAV